VQDWLLVVLPITKKWYPAKCQWFTLVILATQEAEIRRIMIQIQPGQKAYETLSRKNPSQKKGWLSGSSGKSMA
jgi:hypothetical protein